MDKQLFSVIIVFVAIGINIMIILFNRSFVSYPTSCPDPFYGKDSNDPIKMDRIASLEYSITERENEISELNQKIRQLQTLLASANRLQQHSEKVLSTTKSELSSCLAAKEENCNTSHKRQEFDEIVIRTEDEEIKTARIAPDYSSLHISPKEYNWSSTSGYFEEDVKKNPPQKADMNVDITILIISGNCTMKTKYPSESVDLLNRWYPVKKIYLNDPNDVTVASQIHQVLNDITTKYVLMIDSSVEFTHNSNLPRMLALLQSNQVSVVSPMTEDAVSQTLSSNCFELLYHAHDLHIRPGYSGTLSGNNLLCERGGVYFMTLTDTIRQIFPNQPLPLTLLIEAFYLDLKSFDMKVGYCPGSILRYNSILSYSSANIQDSQACNVFRQDEKTMDESSLKAFASKYHISRIFYPTHHIMYLPEPIYDNHDMELLYHPSYYYREQRSILHIASSILNDQSLPLVLLDEELLAAVLLGLPFPWSESIQAHVLQNPNSSKKCDYFDLTNADTIKQLSLYGLDVLRNEEDKSICFGITTTEKKNDDLPISMVIHHLDYPSIVNYLFPLKKMEFLGVDVLVPNNPIAFLEKVYEDEGDMMKEVNLFEQTNSKLDRWKSCERETDPELVSMCVKTPFDYVEDVQKIMDDKNLYY